MKLSILLLAASLPAFAQTQPTAPGSGSGSTTPTAPTTGSTSTSPISPTYRSPSTGGFPSQTGPTSQPIWLDLAVSGRVLLENGAPSPEPVAVLLECVGARSFTGPSHDAATLTDGKGRFSLLVGLNNTPGTPNTRGGGSGLPRLQGCQAVIHLPGYASWRKDLGRLTSLSDFDLGSIRLQRIARGGAGRTISATSQHAPEKARREYVAAMGDAYSHRTSDALRRLDKAVALYPAYAAAHYLAGYLHDRQAERALARDCYRKAAAADPSYVNPILQLAQMAAEENDYSETARLSAQVIALMPEAYAEIYLISAGADFSLGQFEKAEATARAALAAGLDSESPRLRLILAETLWKQKKYAEARQHYLRFADTIREGPEADEARARAAKP